MNVLKWSLFIFFSVVIGFYPLVYIIFDMSQGLLASKPPEVLQSTIWQTAFYQHIFLGAVAMLAGWSQFSKKFRNKSLTFHRNLGKVYLIAVALSGSAGLYIAFYASGGIISKLGFGALALAWLYSSLRAYQSVRKGEVDHHQYWMIRSYALCWAAVTLRIWIPLFQIAIGMEFLAAYRMIAWLCWIPNLIVAEMIISSLRKAKQKRKEAKEVLA